MLVFTDPHY
jgi:hypothetical protein